MSSRAALKSAPGLAQDKAPALAPVRPQNHLGPGTSRLKNQLNTKISHCISPMIISDLPMSSRTSSRSTNSSKTSPSHLRSAFDARAQTRVSNRLRSCASNELDDTKMDEITTKFQSDLAENNVFAWSETTQICRVLNTPSFLSQFGVPLVLELSPTHIFIGTETGRVAAFDYHQNLDFLLDLGSSEPSKGPQKAVATSRVTCITVSATGLFVCAGHADGKLLVWETPRESRPKPRPAVVYPYTVVESLSMEKRAASSDVLGHLQGVAVRNVGFVGDSHQNLVSADASGLVLFHHVSQKLFRKHVASQWLMGQHVASPEDVVDRFSIHDCRLLPIGTAPQLADHLGVMAVITGTSLSISSVCSLNNESAAYPKTHFQVARPKSVFVDSQNLPHGCLAWYPRIELGDGGRKNAKLSYSWDNVVTIAELDAASIAENAMAILSDLKDKDRAIPQLRMVTTARWAAKDPKHRVVALRWLNSEILAALVQETESAQSVLHFLYYGAAKTEKNKLTLELVGLDDMDLQQVSSLPSSQDPSAGSGELFYSHSFGIFRHRPVVLANSHAACSKTLLTGVTSKWADRLSGLIAAGKFAAALVCAFRFYCSENSGELLLSGLPHTASERHEVVEPFLLDIMRESVEPMFGSGQNFVLGPGQDFVLRSGQVSVLDMKDALWLYFHVAGVVMKNRGSASDSVLDILDRVHEVVSSKSAFFEILEPFVLGREILTIPPSVFKSLVEEYVAKEAGEKLTEIVCILDPKTLNIDLTLKLCEAHGLRECLVYIWTALLKDFIRPFFVLLAELDSADVGDDQKRLVYIYLSYILSGRQFPTDKFMSPEDEESARTQICKVLFSLHEFQYETPQESPILIDKSAVFPYLHKLLQYDAFETLAMLNEFFENPCLNTEAKGTLNRQYVVEALMDISRETATSFTRLDRVHLAVFIARNYPKYIQFIRISDSVLKETVETLCNTPEESKEDAELALECLLPVYEVDDEDYFLAQIRAAKFYRVAFTMFRSRQRFSSALEVWLQQQRDAGATDITRNFSALADIVSHTFTGRGVSQTEQTRLLNIIRENFKSLISTHRRDMVSLANSYNVSMHQYVLQCDDRKLAFEYLQTLFGDTESPFLGTGRIELLVRYIALSCVFDKDNVVVLVDVHSQELGGSTSALHDTRKELRASHEFNALAKLSRNLKTYQSAINEIKEGLSFSVSQEDWNSVERLIDTGVSVCDRDERCWQPLIHILVALKPPLESSKALPESVNQGIYKCFRKIIDAGEKQQNPQLFTDILQSVIDEATVSQVRGVLQDVLTSFFFDSEIHNITLAKLNKRTRKHMDYVMADRLRGWILKDKNCASCGKSMWGEGALERHRQAWEAREKAKAFRQKFDKSEFKDCELTFFKCLHGYHSQCLERLGSVGSCVICTE